MGSKQPTSTESCYDDTGSSSLPPLADTYIAFDQTFAPPAPPPPPPPPPVNVTGGGYFISTAAASLEHVPCFSNYPQISTATNTTTTPQHYIPLMDMNKSFPKDLASSCFNPVLTLPSCDKKVLKSVLDQLSKIEGSPHQQQKSSSESYLSETALSSSMWYPFQS